MFAVMRSISILVLPVAALIACAHGASDRRAESANVVDGAPSDVATKDGTYAGYCVSRRCREQGCIGVTGTGARWAPGMERDRINEDVRFREGIEHFRAQLLNALRDVPSIHTSGFGAGCAASGLTIWMKSWGEVDRAIAVTGAFVSENDLREEVTFCVAAFDEILVVNN
jgi:hypothetical protein